MILTPEQIEDIRQWWWREEGIWGLESPELQRHIPDLLASHDEVVALVRESAEAIAAYEAGQKRLEVDDYYSVREAARIKMYKSLAKIRAAGLLS